jgi:hypothetical protein
VRELGKKEKYEIYASGYEIVGPYSEQLEKNILASLKIF